MAELYGVWVEKSMAAAGRWGSAFVIDADGNGCHRHVRPASRPTSAGGPSLEDGEREPPPAVQERGESEHDCPREDQERLGSDREGDGVVVPTPLAIRIAAPAPA